MKKYFPIIFTLTLLAACQPQEEAKKADRAFTFNKPGGAPIVPTRASSITLSSPATSPNFDSTPTVTLTGVVAGETAKLYDNAGCTNEIGSALATSTSVNITTQTLDIGAHTFYTKSFNTVSASPCSGAMLSYTYSGIAPTIASSMTLQSPASSPGTDSTPTFTLAGVVSGETIKIYTNALCTTEVASVVANATTMLMTTSALAPGVYNFYSKSINTAGSSACSGVLSTYTYSGVLPSAGSGLTMVNPLTSPNYDSTPTVSIIGVANGDTVSLYSNAICTTLIGSAAATSTTVQITISALAVGTHSIYTKSTNVVGSSSCSGVLASYEYLGPPPTVRVSWTANREAAVNTTGGGYRVYYSTTSGFDTATADYVDVPYVAGPTSPTSVDIPNFMAGTYYFKIAAFSALNPPGQTGGSMSSPGTQFSLSLP